MNLKHHYTKEVLSKICAESYSYRQCLEKMGVVPAGGNYASLKKYIRLHNIDISHFTLQGWNKGKVIGPKRPLEDYLSNKVAIQSWKLKCRLIKENIFEHKCNNCNKKTWFNDPIPIELHHKDGNHLNNELSNLELLCPNCHALTDNYRAKNK
jgi:5-methylcytosine-specific restriction endonuclease McrA